MPIFSAWEDAQRQTIQDYILIAKWVFRLTLLTKGSRISPTWNKAFVFAKSSELGPFALTLRPQPKNLTMMRLLTWHHVLSPCLLAQLFYLVLENQNTFKILLWVQVWAQEVCIETLNWAIHCLGSTLTRVGSKSLDKVGLSSIGTILIFMVFSKGAFTLGVKDSSIKSPNTN
jgi:hypothetical protein